MNNIDQSKYVNLSYNTNSNMTKIKNSFLVFVEYGIYQFLDIFIIK